MSSVSLDTARAAKKRLAAELSEHPAVNGVGIKPVEDGYALKVNLVKEEPELTLPSEVDGVDVHVEVTGPGFPQVA